MTQEPFAIVSTNFIEITVLTKRRNECSVIFLRLIPSFLSSKPAMLSTLVNSDANFTYNVSGFDPTLNVLISDHLDSSFFRDISNLTIALDIELFHLKRKCLARL